MNKSTGLEPLSWYALFALLLAMFAITVGYGIVLPILPFLIERLIGATDAAKLSWHTGLLTGTYILAIFVFAPLWGMISDRWGRQPVLLLGLVGFATSVALSTFVDNLLFLYLGRAFDGLFAAAITPAAYALVGDRAPSDEWRAHRFALINAAGTAGFFVGPLLGGVGLRVFYTLFTEGRDQAPSIPFLTSSTLALLAAFTIWRLVPTGARPIARGSAPQQRHVDHAVMLRLWAIAFVTSLAIGAFEVGLTLRGKQILGMDAFQIGMIFAECSLVMFLAQLLVFSPFVKPTVTRWFLTPALAILTISLVTVPFANDAIAASITVASVAASAGILSPVITYWVSLSAGETQGSDLGRATAAASIGQALGSAVGGLLFSVAFGPRILFIATAAIVLAGLATSLKLPKLLPRPRMARHPKIFRTNSKRSSVDMIAGDAAMRTLKHPHQHN